MNRFRHLLSLLVFLGLVLPACASGSTPSSSGSAFGTASNPISLVQWTADNPLIVQWYQAEIAEYTKLHPYVSIKLLSIPFFDEHSKLLATFQAGVGAPDLADVEISRFGSFLKGQIGFLDLTDRLQPYVADLVREPYVYKDRIYGVESSASPVVLYYNQTLFQAAGIQTPINTWAQYIAAGQLLKQKTGAAMCGLGVNDYDPWTPLMLQFGGQFFDTKGNFVLDSPENLKALQFYSDLIHKYNVCIAAPGGDQYNPTYWSAVQGGKIASLWSADWMAGIISSSAPKLTGDWRAQPMPTGPDSPLPTSTVGGTALTISKQSKYQEAAWEYLKFTYLSTEAAVAYNSYNGLLPNYRPSWTSPAIVKPSPYFGNQSLGALFIQLATDNKLPVLPQAPFVSGTYDSFTRDALGPVILGQKSPEQALKDTVTDVKTQMGQ